MREDNRVLSRKNARELTAEEIGHVHGGIQTEAPCSVLPNGQVDGPALDCGPGANH